MGYGIAMTSNPLGGGSALPPPGLPTNVTISETGTRTLEQPLQRTVATISVVITLATGNPATWANVWLTTPGFVGKYKGTFAVAGTTTITFTEYAPTGIENWFVTVNTGQSGAENTPGSVTTSNTLSVAAIGLPGGTLISALSVNAITGTAYNGVTLMPNADGLTYFGLPDGLNLTCATSVDPNGWYIGVTVRKVTAGGVPASSAEGGLESAIIQEVQYLPGETQTVCQNILWWPFNPVGSTATVLRFEFWGVRRPGAWPSDRQIQTLPGGLQYLDVLCGASPAGAIPGTRVTNVPAPAAFTGLTVTIVNGPTSPTGAETYGWTGTVTLPGSLTNYNGCELTQQWAGGIEGGAFQTLPASATTFASDNAYPRGAAAINCTFRAYPMSRDNQRGTPYSCTVTVGAHSTLTLDLTQSDPTTLGKGLIIGSDGKPMQGVDGSGNVFINPDFEQGLTGWSGFATGVVTTPVRSGTKAMQLPATAWYSEGQLIPCKPGESWLFQAWVNQDSGFSGSLYNFITYYSDLAGTATIAGIGTTTVSTVAGSWVLLSGSFTVPTTGTAPKSMSVGVANGGTTAAGKYYYADSCSLTRAPSTGAGIGTDSLGNLIVKTSATIGTDGSGNVIIPTLAVQTSNLAAGSLGDLSKYSSTVRAVTIVFGMPSLPSSYYPTGSMFMNTADGKVYRTTNGTTWDTKSAPADLFTGTLASGVVYAGTVAAANVTAGSLYGHTITGSTLVLALTGITTTINNSNLSDGYGAAGVRCRNDSSGAYSVVCAGQMAVVGGSNKTNVNTGYIDVVLSGASMTVSPSVFAMTGLLSAYPGAGTKQFWYDPADSNRVKFAA